MAKPCHGQSCAIEPLWLVNGSGRLRIGDVSVCCGYFCNKAIAFKLDAHRDLWPEWARHIGSNEIDMLIRHTAKRNGPWYFVRDGDGDRVVPEGWTDPPSRRERADLA